LHSRHRGPTLIDAASSGENAAKPVELQLRVQQLRLCLGVIQLLILQPGADMITIVFYLFKQVLEGCKPPRYLPVTA
jgi:hypothetical protein